MLKRTLMCLFEGLTRKIAAFNYLRFIYSEPFSKVNLDIILEFYESLLASEDNELSRS